MSSISGLVDANSKCKCLGLLSSANFIEYPVVKFNTPPSASVGLTSLRYLILSLGSSRILIIY